MRMNYQNTDRSSKTLSGTFNSASEQLTQALLEQIFNGALASFADNPVYTSLTRTLTSGHAFDVWGKLSASYKVPHTPDNVFFSASGNYAGRDYRNYNLYDINYNAVGNRATDYQFIKNSPDNSWSFNANAGYAYIFKPGSYLSITPEWAHTSTTKDSYLYQLDRLEDIGIFGQLPDNYLSALDNNQTYMSSPD